MRSSTVPHQRGAPRAVVFSASGVNFLLGIWLVASPWILGYVFDAAALNAMLAGGLIAVLAFIRATGVPRTTALSVINACIGLWLFVSAFWIDSSAAAAWNAATVGAGVLMLALISAAAEGPEHRPDPYDGRAR